MGLDVELIALFAKYGWIIISFGHETGGGACGSSRYYGTSLTWKETYPPLKNKKSKSLGRLNNLVKNLTPRNQLFKINLRKTLQRR